MKLDITMEEYGIIINALHYYKKVEKKGNFQQYGESEWVFINSGFPMNRAKGKSARDAVITAMEAK
jgi:hypothetical protein